MIFVLFYLLIGLVSYSFISDMDGIKLRGNPSLAVVAALVIWMIIWLPVLLYKIGNRDT